MLKCLIVVVEGETKIFYFSFRFFLFAPLHNAEPNHIVISPAAHRVKQIKVYVICFKALKLLIKYSLRVLHAVYQPCREFCCEIKALARIFF